MKTFKQYLKKTIELTPGRTLSPTPKNGESWINKGKPKKVHINKLDLHPDSLAIAQSVWNWDSNYRHTNKNPIKAVHVDGKLHVLDGYHRVVQHARDDKKHIHVQEVE